MRSVFFDVDTQNDFVYPAGALYVPGAERIEPALARLTRYAGENSMRVISTMDAHNEDDAEFRDWLPHCVAGTLGQHKLNSTLLEKRAVVGLERGQYAVEGAEQILVEKKKLDCFTNPNLEGLLGKLGAERCVVYGVVTEFCVRLAAIGLLRMGMRVEVVRDAVQTLRAEDGQRALKEIVAAGGRLITVDEVCGA